MAFSIVIATEESKVTGNFMASFDDATGSWDMSPLIWEYLIPLANWCNENCLGEWSARTGEFPHTIEFADQRDATLFRMFSYGLPEDHPGRP